MGRSQRHMLLEQNTTAAGEIHAEGAVAPGIAMQVDPTAYNVMEAGVAAPPYVAGQDYREVDLTGVEVPGGPPGGPLQGSSMTGAIPEGAPTPIGEAPRLTSLDPTGSPIQSGDVTLTIHGAGFTAETILIWNEAEDTSVFVDEATLTTTVKTDLATVPSTCTVQVHNGAYFSNTLAFQMLDEAPVEPDAPPPSPEEPPPEERLFPIGPANIGLVTDHADGLEIGLMDALDVQIGDTVLVEATFNASVNGTFQVLAINPIVVDNMIVLDAPIENKGRLTVTGAA